MKLREDGIRTKDAIKSEINQLGLKRWRSHIKELIFDHFFAMDTTSTYIHLIPTFIDSQLKRYTKLEKISLLELAVWKASCLWFDGSMNFDIMQDILDQWAVNECFDPVSYKAERRVAGGLAVIMRGVIQYID
eukprot:CAMPEP_0184470562 /NCGR_PEP_ID=MMETSP0740-20130409/93444_1 /TAXON_ID=385413 /ORGANISM="Thalassiosira miniscula, Strain CCMP1093" /LENGTH=132 /DNA_ID=CAMNT_0026846765 /DNA_START=18 /DNA_END=416 /DNA_ORIENTATION=-